MIRKDYVKIAKAISESRSTDIGDVNVVAEDRLIENLCTIFKDDNPNFNPSIFRDACKEEMRWKLN